MRDAHALVRLGLALGGLCMSLAASSPASMQRPLLGNVAVMSLTVESLPFRDSPERPDRDQVLRRLAEEATARAVRTLMKQHLADPVAQFASPAAASGALVLTGTVRLPVSIPAGQRGGRAMFRGGRFASATVVLRRSDGTLVAEGQSHLNWDDVRWVRGARFPRTRTLDDVLVDAVRKATDHAVKRLRRPDPETPSS